MFEFLCDPNFWKENIIKIVGITFAIFTFITERVITYYREKKNAKYNWFLKVIVEPHLEEIKTFYLETDKELRIACEDLRKKNHKLDNIEYSILVRNYCNGFKNRRKRFFNNFVAMIGAFDKDMSTEVDSIVNKLDDTYVTAIDYNNVDANTDGLLGDILGNKAELYQTLFKAIS